MVATRQNEDSARLAVMIHRLLERRPAVAVSELCARAGADEGLVRSHLETMVARGDIECLRPIGYAKPDRDFFRKKRPGVNRFDDEREMQIGRDHMRLAGLAMACLAD